MDDPSVGRWLSADPFGVSSAVGYAFQKSEVYNILGLSVLGTAFAVAISKTHYDTKMEKRERGDLRLLWPIP